MHLTNIKIKILKEENLIPNRTTFNFEYLIINTRVKKRLNGRKNII